MQVARSRACMMMKQYFTHICICMQQEVAGIYICEMQLLTCNLFLSKIEIRENGAVGAKKKRLCLRFNKLARRLWIRCLNLHPFFWGPNCLDFLMGNGVIMRFWGNYLANFASFLDDMWLKLLSLEVFKQNF